MYALHLPGEERPASRGERVTPLYDRLAAKGCVYTEANGWGDCDVHGGEPVLADGRAVGVTTSGAYGHYTGKSLGFAYVEPRLAAPGTTFGIDILGEPRAATVLPGPVYDPGNERLRA